MARPAADGPPAEPVLGEIVDQGEELLALGRLPERCHTIRWMRKGRRRAAVAAVAGAFVVTGAAAALDGSAPGPACAEPSWPQPRQSSCASGSVLDATAPSPVSATRLRRAWTTRLVAPIGQPVAAGDRVFAVAGSRLWALDLATGRSRWSVPAGPAAATSDGGDSPVVSGSILVRMSADNILRRFDSATGRLLWARDAGGLDESGWFHQSVVADGRWYQSKGEELVAFDAARGVRLWSRSLECFACGVAVAGGHVFAAGSRLSLPSTPGKLFALDARTGRRVWSASGVASFTTVSSPLVVAGTVIVVTTDATPAPDDPTHFTWTFYVEAFRASDGLALWHTRLGIFPGFSPGSTASANESLVAYPGTDGMLYALDTKTGLLRWSVRVGDPKTAATTPAIANGVVWIVDASGRLRAFAAADGRSLWSSRRERAATPPIVAAGSVLVGTSSGTLVAYRVARARG